MIQNLALAMCEYSLFLSMFTNTPWSLLLNVYLVIPLPWLTFNNADVKNGYQGAFVMPAY